MIRAFRYIALLEGGTTLALFLVAMPAKYWLDYPQLVPPVGMVHGIAFVAYILAMLRCLPGQGLTPANWVTTVLAAFVPFGSFLNDPMLRHRQLAAAAAR